jgi:uncharacterized protein YjbI with pentapeptide repeats
MAAFALETGEREGDWGSAGGAGFAGATFRDGAGFAGTVFAGAAFPMAVFTGTIFAGTAFTETVFAGAGFAGAAVEGGTRRADAAALPTGVPRTALLVPLRPEAAASISVFITAQRRCM